MRWARGVRQIAGLSVLALTLAPAAALPCAAMFDRGPTEGLRASAFPAALALWDPLVWLGIQQSVVAALVIALGSFTLGVWLGNALGRWRFWGHGFLAFWALAPLMIPPVLGALGLRTLLEDAWPRLGTWSPGAPGWIAWIWMGWIRGAPWVALVTRATIVGVDPAWEDVARVEGVRSTRVWWTLIWPLIRPRAAAAAGAVFALALLDPTVPLVFGLRRTLAFQIVASSIGPAPAIARAATLALLGVAIAMLGRRFFRFRSPSPVDPPEGVPRSHLASAGGRKATTITVPLVLWIGVAWTPVLVAWSETTRSTGASESTAKRRAVITSLVERLDDPKIRAVVVQSLQIGGLAALIALLLALMGREANQRSWRQLGTPPLAIGVGVLTIPYLLSGAAEGISLRSGSFRPVWMREVATALDPYATPGVTLIWALAVSHLWILVATTDSYRDKTRSERSEAAITLGATKNRARRTVVWPLTIPALARSTLATAIFAAANLTPALVLSPTSAARTTGPEMLLMCDEPGGLGRACALGLAMLVLNGFAWILLDPRVMLRGDAALPS